MSHCRSTPATPDGRLGICIWEGESVEAVRQVVEGAVGAWSYNEYCRDDRRRAHPAARG